MTRHGAERQIHGATSYLALNSEKRQWEQPSYRIHEIKITLDSFKLVFDKFFPEAIHHIQDTFAFLVNKH